VAVAEEFGFGDSAKNEMTPPPFVAFVLLGLVLSACTRNDSKEPVPPVILPISLGEAGPIVNMRIRVVDPNAYYFVLYFYYREEDPADRARVRTLMGAYAAKEKAADPGVPTPVLLKITCPDGALLDQKEIDPLLTSWGADHFAKNIGFTRLLPGLYDIRLVSQRASPEFEGTPVKFTIGSDKYKSIFKSNPSDRTCGALSQQPGEHS
jgi:hypothetical protein